MRDRQNPANRSTPIIAHVAHTLHLPFSSHSIQQCKKMILDLRSSSLSHNIQYPQTAATIVAMVNGFYYEFTLCFLLEVKKVLYYYY